MMRVMIDFLPLFVLLCIAGEILLSVVRARRRGASSVATSWALPLGLASSVAGLALVLPAPAESFAIRAFGVAMLLIATEQFFRAGIAYGLSERSHHGGSAGTGRRS